jgi:hypothetical protein
MASSISEFKHEQEGWDVRVTGDMGAPPIIVDMHHVTDGKYRCEFLIRKTGYYVLSVKHRNVHIRYAKLNPHTACTGVSSGGWCLMTACR